METAWACGWHNNPQKKDFFFDSVAISTRDCRTVSQVCRWKFGEDNVDEKSDNTL